LIYLLDLLTEEICPARTERPDAGGILKRPGEDILLHLYKAYSIAPTTHSQSGKNNESIKKKNSSTIFPTHPLQASRYTDKSHVANTARKEAGEEGDVIEPPYPTRGYVTPSFTPEDIEAMLFYIRAYQDGNSKS
jgi:hypothetical protein